MVLYLRTSIICVQTNALALGSLALISLMKRFEVSLELFGHTHDLHYMSVFQQNLPVFVLFISILGQSNSSLEGFRKVQISILHRK